MSSIPADFREGVVDDPLLRDLTPPQQEAVTQTEGPLLVLAAAGSGKTRVITRRAAYLVRSVGIPPWHVLCITFTNKAAGEMRERIGSLLNERQARAMTISTFHALCARLLREYAEHAGLRNDYVIFDSDDSRRAIKQAMKELDVSTERFKPRAVLGRISNAKNLLMDAEAFIATHTDFVGRAIGQLFRRYEEILTRSNAVDFDDLLMYTARMLQRSDTVRQELQQRYQYVLIDEYQDTNQAQFVIAHALSKEHGNLCVVGDPDQSIYGWRGANIRNILEFEEHYPATKVVALGQNYRSTPQILQIADTLIQQNRARRHKPLFTENAAGDDVRCVQAGDAEHEAEVVIEFLRQQREAGLRWADMAVFYRANALSRVLEEQLMAASMPYIVARGTAFYQRKEIKDALAYLRLIANPDDEVSLLRVINEPKRSIGNTTVEHLQAHAVANGCSLWQALSLGRSTALTSRAAGAVAKFAKMVDTWRQKVDSYDERALGFVPGVRDVVEMVLRDSGLEDFYKKDPKNEEHTEKLANLQELVSAAQRFDDQYTVGETDEEGNDLAEPTGTAGDVKLLQKLADWLTSISLTSDIDQLDEATGAVTLMTLHGAKGLEFPVVAMVGLEDGLLPHANSSDSADQVEEERRLCFVGITRAQKHLMLSHARYRQIRGITQRTIPSPFLRELGQDCVRFEDRSGERDAWAMPSGMAAAAVSRTIEGDGDERSDAFADESGDGLEVGTLVRHAKFGEGRIMQLSPRHNPTRARVHFQRVGVRTLMLEYARLERVL
ncbi:MAG: UvrD-helicase domain-containing protein [Phycisphaeraceae bacterium]